ncbi:MAG: hypothetical protein ACPGRZ_15835 [Alphaproteobacteria bacterium]
MRSKNLTAALAGAAFFLTLAGGPTIAQPVNDDQVRLCTKHVAEMERTVARQTKGEERKRIIAMLGDAKKACFRGDIGAAYQSASKGLQLAKTQPAK